MRKKTVTAKRSTARHQAFVPGSVPVAVRPDSWVLIPALVLLAVGIVMVASASIAIAEGQGLPPHHYLLLHLVVVVMGITRVTLVCGLLKTRLPIEYPAWRIVQRSTVRHISTRLVLAKGEIITPPSECHMGEPFLLMEEKRKRRICKMTLVLTKSGSLMLRFPRLAAPP